MLLSKACYAPNTRRPSPGLPEGQMIDWVDPETAEVRQLDGLQNTLINHCAQQPGFLDEHTALVDAIFRLLLVNGNTPISVEELAARLQPSGGYDPQDDRRPARIQGPETICSLVFWSAEACFREDLPWMSLLRQLACPCSSTDRAPAF